MGYLPGSPEISEIVSGIAMLIVNKSAINHNKKNSPLTLTVNLND
jgi:hypothetical protein